jgi:hypothetical protein
MEGTRQPHARRALLTLFFGAREQAWEMWGTEKYSVPTANSHSTKCFVIVKHSDTGSVVK